VLRTLLRLVPRMLRPSRFEGDVDPLLFRDLD
jgi:hypothetical protein